MCEQALFSVGVLPFLVLPTRLVNKMRQFALQRDEPMLEDSRPPAQRLIEAPLLGRYDLLDELALPLQLRIRRRHRLNPGGCQLCRDRRLPSRLSPREVP